MTRRTESNSVQECTTRWSNITNEDLMRARSILVVHLEHSLCTHTLPASVQSSAWLRLTTLLLKDSLSACAFLSEKRPMRYITPGSSSLSIISKTKLRLEIPTLGTNLMRGRTALLLLLLLLPESADSADGRVGEVMSVACWGSGALLSCGAAPDGIGDEGLELERRLWARRRLWNPRVMSAGGGGLVADVVDALLLRGMFAVAVVDVELVLAGDGSDGLDVKTGYIYIQDERVSIVWKRREKERERKRTLCTLAEVNLYHWEKKGKTETPQHTQKATLQRYGFTRTTELDQSHYGLGSCFEQIAPWKLLPLWKRFRPLASSLHFLDLAGVYIRLYNQ